MSFPVFPKASNIYIEKLINFNFGGAAVAAAPRKTFCSLRST